jgi:hypothetical protein
MQQEVINLEENKERLLLIGFKECQECHKLYRHLVSSNNGEKKLCKNCKRKEVTNIWFVPMTSKNNYIGKYSMSDEEIKQQIRNLTNTGLSIDEARRRVYGTLKYMRNSKKRNRINYFNKIKNEKLDKEQGIINKKKLIEGLK